VGTGFYGKAFLWGWDMFALKNLPLRRFLKKDGNCGLGIVRKLTERPYGFPKPSVKCKNQQVIFRGSPENVSNLLFPGIFSNTFQFCHSLPHSFSPDCPHFFLIYCKTHFWARKFAKNAFIHPVLINIAVSVVVGLNAGFLMLLAMICQSFFLDE